MADFHQTGKEGEAIAIGYLRQKGYEVLEANWFSDHLEIDIIAKKEEVLVVVEVKTRRTSFFGEPEEFVSKSKQRMLIKAANHYLIKKDLDLEVRFDIIAVLFKGDKYQVNHIEDAFYPTL